MNRAIKPTLIAGNCRSILRERCCIQRSCNQTGGFGIFPQQGCSPCHIIPTNPIYSPYGIDNCQVPVMCCEKPTYCNTLCGLSPMMPCNNRQAIRARCLPTPSENCIQMIANTIITKIRCKIPQEEIALLCCCLPSLIRQIICKSPWLTPNEIIQWLSADIIKESINCFDQTNSNVKNEFHKSKQDHNIKDKLVQQRKDNKSDDNFSMKSHEDDNDSLSSYRSTGSANSDDSSLSQNSSKSALGLPKSISNKKDKSRSPSTRSFISQQNKDNESGSHHSLTPSSWSTGNKSKQSDGNSPVHLEEDERSSASHNKDNFGSNEDFDRKSIDLSPKPESVSQSSRIHIEYPGKRDPNAIHDVEKCLAFYQKIREYFDDDVAAMLLKCCLCYGDCSGKR